MPVVKTLRVGRSGVWCPHLLNADLILVLLRRGSALAVNLCLFFFLGALQGDAAQWEEGLHEGAPTCSSHQPLPAIHSGR